MSLRVPKIQRSRSFSTSNNNTNNKPPSGGDHHSNIASSSSDQHQRETSTTTSQQEQPTVTTARSMTQSILHQVPSSSFASSTNSSSANSPSKNSSSFRRQKQQQQQNETEENKTSTNDNNSSQEKEEEETSTRKSPENNNINENNNNEEGKPSKNNEQQQQEEENKKSSLKPSVAVADSEGNMSCPLCEYTEKSIVAFKQHVVECRLANGIDPLMQLVVLRRVPNIFDVASPLRSNKMRNISTLQSITIFPGRQAPKRSQSSSLSSSSNNNNGQYSSSSSSSGGGVVDEELSSFGRHVSAKDMVAAVSSSSKNSRTQSYSGSSSQSARNYSSYKNSALIHPAARRTDARADAKKRPGAASARAMTQGTAKAEVHGMKLILRSVGGGNENEEQNDKNKKVGSKKGELPPRSPYHQHDSKNNSPVKRQQSPVNVTEFIARRPTSSASASSAATTVDSTTTSNDKNENSTTNNQTTTTAPTRKSVAELRSEKEAASSRAPTQCRVCMDLSDLEITRPVAEELIDILGQNVTLDNFITEDPPIEELDLNNTKCRTIDVEEIFVLAIKRSKSVHTLRNLKSCKFHKRIEHSPDCQESLSKNSEKMRQLHDEAEFYYRVSGIRTAERDTTHSLIQLIEEEYELRQEILKDEWTEFRTGRRALDRRCEHTEECERTAAIREAQRQQRLHIDNQEHDHRLRIMGQALIFVFSEVLVKGESIMRAAMTTRTFESIRSLRAQERIAIFVAKKRQKDRIYREFRERAMCEQAESRHRKELMRSFDVGLEVIARLSQRDKKFANWIRSQAEERERDGRVEAHHREVMEREQTTTRAALESKFMADIRGVQVRDQAQRESLENREARIRHYYGEKFTKLVQLRLKECELKINAMLFADRALGIEMQRLMCLEVLPTVTTNAHYTTEVPPPTLMMSSKGICQPPPLSIAPNFGIDIDMPHDWMGKTSDVEKRCAKLAVEERNVQTAVLTFLQRDYVTVLTLEFELFTLPFVEIEPETGCPSSVVQETVASFQRNAEQDGTIDEMCEQVLRRRCVWCDSASSSQILRSRLSVRGLRCEIRVEDVPAARRENLEQDDDDEASLTSLTLPKPEGFEKFSVVIPVELLSHKPMIELDGVTIDLDAQAREEDERRQREYEEECARLTGKNKNKNDKNENESDSNTNNTTQQQSPNEDVLNTPQSGGEITPQTQNVDDNNDNDDQPLIGRVDSSSVSQKSDTTTEQTANALLGRQQQRDNKSDIKFSESITFVPDADDAFANDDDDNSGRPTPSPSQPTFFVSLPPPPAPREPEPVHLTFTESLTLSFGADPESMEISEMQQLDPTTMPQISPLVIRTMIQSIKYELAQNHKPKEVSLMTKRNSFLMMNSTNGINNEQEKLDEDLFFSDSVNNLNNTARRDASNDELSGTETENVTPSSTSLSNTFDSKNKQSSNFFGQQSKERDFDSIIFPTNRQVPVIRKVNCSLSFTFENLIVYNQSNLIGDTTGGKPGGIGGRRMTKTASFFQSTNNSNAAAISSPSSPTSKKKSSSSSSPVVFLDQEQQSPQISTETSLMATSSSFHYRLPDLRYKYEASVPQQKTPKLYPVKGLSTMYVAVAPPIAEFSSEPNHNPGVVVRKFIEKQQQPLRLLPDSMLTSIRPLFHMVPARDDDPHRGTYPWVPQQLPNFNNTILEWSVEGSSSQDRLCILEDFEVRVLTKERDIFAVDNIMYNQRQVVTCTNGFLQPSLKISSVILPPKVPAPANTATTPSSSLDSKPTSASSGGGGMSPTTTTTSGIGRRRSSMFGAGSFQFQAISNNKNNQEEEEDQQIQMIDTEGKCELTFNPALPSFLFNSSQSQQAPSSSGGFDSTPATTNQSFATSTQNLPEKLELDEEGGGRRHSTVSARSGVNEEEDNKSNDGEKSDVKSEAEENENDANSSSKASSRNNTPSSTSGLVPGGGGGNSSSSATLPQSESIDENLDSKNIQQQQQNLLLQKLVEQEISAEDVKGILSALAFSVLPPSETEIAEGVRIITLDFRFGGVPPPSATTPSTSHGKKDSGNKPSSSSGVQRHTSFGATLKPGSRGYYGGSSHHRHHHTSTASSALNSTQQHFETKLPVTARIQFKIPVECYREPTAIKIAHPVMVVHQTINNAPPERFQEPGVYPPVYIPFCQDVTAKNVEDDFIDSGKLLIRLAGEGHNGDGIAFCPDSTLFSAIDSVFGGSQNRGETNQPIFNVLPPTSLQTIPIEVHGNVVAYITRGKIIKEAGDEGVGDPDDYRDMHWTFTEDCPIQSLQEILRHCVIFTQGDGWNPKYFGWVKRRVVLELSIGKNEREVHITKEVEIRPAGPLLSISEEKVASGCSVTVKENAAPTPLIGCEVSADRQLGAVSDFNGGFLIAYVSEGWEPCDCISLLCGNFNTKQSSFSSSSVSSSPVVSTSPYYFSASSIVSHKKDSAFDNASPLSEHDNNDNENDQQQQKGEEMPNFATAAAALNTPASMRGGAGSPKDKSDPLRDVLGAGGILLNQPSPFSVRDITASSDALGKSKSSRSRRGTTPGSADGSDNKRGGDRKHLVNIAASAFASSTSTRSTIKNPAPPSRNLSRRGSFAAASSSMIRNRRLSRSNSMVVRALNAEQIQHHTSVLFSRLRSVVKATIFAGPSFGFSPSSMSVTTKELLYKNEVIGRITVSLCGIYIQFLMNDPTSLNPVPSVTRKIVNELIRCLQFQHTSKDPQHVHKLVSVCLSESVAATFSRSVLAVDIEAVDDVTQILTKSSTLHWHQNPEPCSLFPFGEATLADPDTDYFNGGMIKVSTIAGASRGDEFSFRLITSRTPVATSNTSSGTAFNPQLKSPFFDLKYNAEKRHVYDRKGMLLAIVSTFYKEDVDGTTEISLSFPRIIKEEVKLETEAQQSSNDHFSPTYVKKIGVVNLGLASFLLNCICFSNSNTLERPRTTKRSFLVRVKDPKNPIDGKAKIHLEMSPPYLAFAGTILTSNSTWNYEVTLPAGNPEDYATPGVQMGKNLVSYWEHMNFDGLMSMRFTAMTDKGRRVQLTFIILEKLLPSPLKLSKDGLSVLGAKDAIICKFERREGTGEQFNIIWGPSSGAKEKTMTKHYLTAILKSLGVKATNEKGGLVSIATGATINLTAKACEGEIVMSSLKLTSEILPPR